MWITLTGFGYDFKFFIRMIQSPSEFEARYFEANKLSDSLNILEEIYFCRSRGDSELCQLTT
jgi:hypothetical protein